ncbi:MAG: cation efflux protein [Gemmatimonadetes bacterium]|nr:cation efflux protein [Gemmatimonadota bacterium]
MIRQLVTFAIRKRVFVFGAAATLLGLGLWALSTIPFEAFPDITANSVSVITEAPGLAGQEVEQLVTFPIERALLGLPDAQAVRSTTKFGLVITQVVFRDRVDPYFARQLVSQRLGDVGRQLPPGVTPVLGPISTAMGEVYQYVLTSTSPEWDLMSLKTLQDYTLAPALRTVDGVVEVNSWGGRIEQFQVELDPRRLSQASLTLGDVERALASDNSNFGGTYTESRDERFIVHGVGRLTGLDDIGRVTVATRDGVPIRLGDLGTVVRGSMPRQGAVTYNAGGEVVSGMVIMRKGANAQDVIARIKARVAVLVPTLPPGVQLVPFYDQTELVGRTTHTIQKNLLLGGALVVVLLWVFLRNIAASLIVAIVIPFSMLWAFVMMRWFGFSANLMSLGALDFGLLVDGSVVIIENIMRRSGEPGGPGERIRKATVEVGRPVVFGIAIIIAVYLPIFALEGTERKMFVPMAFTVVAAILGSLLIALTLVPALARVFLQNAKEPHSPRFEQFRGFYRVFLARTLRHPGLIIGALAVLFVMAIVGATRLGREFMPRLDEGSVLVQSRRLPSTALGQGTDYSVAIERALLTLPEVQSAVSKLGRPDLATEAMGTYESDTYVGLRDRSEWRPGGKDALLRAMDSALSEIPGLTFAFTQPIQMRLDEAETGITTDVGVKVIGSNPDTLALLAARVERVLVTVRGAAEVRATAASRVKQVRVILDREMMARYGVGSGTVGAEVERALGASIATAVVDGPRRIGVAVRMPDATRIDPALFRQLPVPVAGGAVVPLGTLASVELAESPEAYAHEGGQRLVVVGANIRGRDVVGFVEDAISRLGSEVPLPSGYRYEWGGQYTHQRTALQRLAVLVPLAILAIYLLLFAAFQRVRQAALVLANVPFALVGGVTALWITGLNLSLSASIGFIALFGIAVLNGVVMVSSINDLRAHGAELADATLDGAASRIRPVLMTALVAGFGFVPMAISRSPGAEIQRPLATVVIGGLLTSTLLTLLVLPVLYVTVERYFDAFRRLRRTAPALEPAASGG